MLKNLQLDEVSHCAEGVNPEARVVLFKSEDKMSELQKALDAASSVEKAARTPRSTFEKALDTMAAEQRKLMKAGTTHEQAYAALLKESSEAQALAVAADYAQPDAEPEPAPVELTKAERAIEDKVANVRKATGMPYAQAYATVLRNSPDLQAQLDQEARNNG
jgi:hypothetical protein